MGQLRSNLAVAVGPAATSNPQGTLVGRGTRIEAYCSGPVFLTAARGPSWLRGGARRRARQTTADRQAADSATLFNGDPSENLVFVVRNWFFTEASCTIFTSPKRPHRGTQRGIAWRAGPGTHARFPPKVGVFALVPPRRGGDRPPPNSTTSPVETGRDRPPRTTYPLNQSPMVDNPWKEKPPPDGLLHSYKEKKKNDRQEAKNPCPASVPAKDR